MKTRSIYVIEAHSVSGVVQLAGWVGTRREARAIRDDFRRDAEKGVSIHERWLGPRSLAEGEE